MAQQHAAFDQQYAEHRLTRPFNRFWTVVLYVSIGLSLADIATSRPDLLRGWVLLGLIGLLVAFCGMYHGVLLRRTDEWPMPLRQAIFYFSVQFALLVLLTRYNQNFGWLGFALMGQTSSALPLKQWPLPLLGSFTLVAIPFGLYDAVQRGQWVVLVLFLFQSSIFLGIAILLHLLFGQRYQLVALVTQLQQAKQQLEEQAAQTEELAALRERTRLAREMHDSLGHALVVVNVKLEAAQRLYAVEHARGDAELEATKTLVRDTMGELRRSLANLRAPLPDCQDLPAALHHIAEEARSHNSLHVTCSTTTDVPALSAETSEALWRVAREALANVERHAAATDASLALERQNDSLVLRVVDNGNGINQHDLQRPGHYGIVGMRERVEALGGTLRIVQRPHGGTLVEARVPVNVETLEGWSVRTLEC
jgi:signal transduction histidine kinase